MFCSELILWRVDPIGPLSKSGGITELARINSKETSAFSDVAWIPTLLPSTTLGSVCNSPSACFVASDGHCLRVYQAVIDARTLLAEVNAAAAKSSTMGGHHRGSDESLSSGHSSTAEASAAAAAQSVSYLRERYRIVSTQSTARPGAIIELEAIADAVRDWQSTLMLHAFQEQLITAQSRLPSTRTSLNPSGLIPARMSAVVDLTSPHDDRHFCEPFYALVAEKTPEGAMMHMWRLTVASEDNEEGAYFESIIRIMYVPVC